MNLRVALGLLLLAAWGADLSAQSAADSARITFRAHQPSSPLVYNPGEFNGWVNNATSVMTYDGGLGCWVKTYTFKIHDPADGRRTLGDSVFQYKFNRGGASGGWYSDPLNSETNPNDNNNSVLRLTRLFWFQYLASVSSGQIVRLTAGLVHANSDSITEVRLATAPTRNSTLTRTDITASYNEQTRILDYSLSPGIPQSSYVRLVAVTSQGDSIVFERGGYTAIMRAIPSWAQHGVTLPSELSGDSTTFRIRVPGKDIVFVHVAPVGQNPALSPGIPMYRNPGGDNWWVNVKLDPGVTYEYIYELNEAGTRIYDPWGRWNGTQGSRFSLGPEGLTADDYVWSSLTYVRPPLNRLLVYELNVAELAGGYYGLQAGEPTFRDLSTLMGYFDSLGINAIELMPVTDYGVVGRSGFSWGYDNNSWFALEPGYGDPLDFKVLVDSAHAHGIAVILDVVFNHMNDTGPLWQMAPDVNVNPYFKSCSDLRYNEDNLCFFQDADHWMAETQEIVYAAIKMWVDEYRIDGFRYDYTQGIGWNTADPTKGILGWANKIDADYGGAVYQIVEHLPESPALLYYSGATSGWHDSFRDKVFDEARFRNVPLTEIQNLVLDLGAFPGNDTPSSPFAYADRTGPVNATVTHDEQSLIYEMTTYQSVPLEEALVRDRLYATFMFTSVGIPMLWQGMEFSAPRGWQDGGQKLSYRPVEWYLLPTARGQTHYAYYQALIRQRYFNPALNRGVLRRLGQYPSQRGLVWGFEDTLGVARVMAVANLSGTDQVLRSVPWLAPGTWYSIFDQSPFLAASTTIDSIVVPAYTALVYANVPDSVLLPVGGPNEGPPPAFRLEQNFPNPFNPSTTIRYSLPSGGRVGLVIYDLLGREVSRLVDREEAEGIHQVTWNGRDRGGNRLASGVYVYRMTHTDPTGARSVLARKLILVN